MKEGEKMALSGSFSVSQRNEREKATCVWSATQDIANNKTTITAYLEFFHKYQINIGNRTHKIVINGVEKEVTTTTIACAGADTHRSTSVTVEVPHNADGTKNVTMGFTFSVKATLSGTYYESMSTSTTVNLDTIPRASQPTLSASSTEMTKAVTINTNRASSSFTHTLTYAFGSATGTIAEGVGASYEWTIPLELANQIPDAVSGTGKIYCKTYNGSTLIGTKEVVFGATVPASVVPTRKSFSAVDTTGYMATYGGLIQGKSKLKVDVEAEGAFGSTIKSYKILVGNTTYHGNSITADILGTSNISVSATFTDSRGRTNTVGLGTQLRVYAYTNPKISSMNVYRCDANGTADESGTYIRGVVQASALSLVPNNTCTLKIEYKKQTDTEWTLITTATGASIGAFIPVTAADPNCIYDVRATATDAFTTTTYQVVIPTVYTLMDFKADGMGIAFGKVSTEEGFDVDMEAKFRKSVLFGGRLQVPMGQGGSYIDSVTYKNRASIHVYGAVTNGSYYPIITGVTHSGHTWNLGAIGDVFGFSAFKSDRATNGVDYYCWWDIAQGYMGTTFKVRAARIEFGSNYEYGLDDLGQVWASNVYLGNTKSIFCHNSEGNPIRAVMMASYDVLHLGFDASGIMIGNHGLTNDASIYVDNEITLNAPKVRIGEYNTAGQTSTGVALWSSGAVTIAGSVPELAFRYNNSAAITSSIYESSQGTLTSTAKFRAPSIEFGSNYEYGLDPLGQVWASNIYIGKGSAYYVFNSSGTAINSIYMDTSNILRFGYGASDVWIGNHGITNRTMIYGTRIDFCCNTAGTSETNPALSLVSSAGGANLTLRPTTVNAVATYLGDASYYYNAIYYKTLSQVSDRNDKKDIEDIIDKYLQLWDLLSVKTFRYTNDAEEKVRVGLIAQEVEAAALEVGLTLDECGFISKNWVETEEYEGWKYGLDYIGLAMLTMAKLKSLMKQMKSN